MDRLKVLCHPDRLIYGSYSGKKSTGIDIAHALIFQDPESFAKARVKRIYVGYHHIAVWGYGAKTSFSWR